MMKRSILILITLSFMFHSCENSENDIKENPNATATFGECIELAFSISNTIRIDTALVEEVQEALRIARTVDIELEDIGRWSGCMPIHDLDIFFSYPLDSTQLSDYCSTGIQEADSLLQEYGYHECGVEGYGNYVEDGYVYTFRTEEYLNVGLLASQFVDLDGIIYAGVPPIDCDQYYCTGLSMSKLDDVFTFKFQDWCSRENPIVWIVVVVGDKATLLSKGV